MCLLAAGAASRGPQLCMAGGGGGEGGRRGREGSIPNFSGWGVASQVEARGHHKARSSESWSVDAGLRSAVCRGPR